MIHFRNNFINILLINRNHLNINEIKFNLKFIISKRLLSMTKPVKQMVTNEESVNEILDAQTYRSMNGITCFGHSIADPMQSFECHEWPKRLSQRLRQLGFRTPTPVQSQSLPIILQNRDLIAIANSGSGKTLCFVLPALIRSLTAGLDYWPKCLIITPTRELTHQIEKEVKKFRYARSVCLYGGVSREIQSMLLKEVNPHIVIATPGRLSDVLDENLAKLEFIDYVVIDEADRMLSLGYEKAFRNVMQLLPKKRQTLMFSATWPQSVQSIADDYLRDYIRVNVSQNTTNASLTVNRNIEQIVEICEESDKAYKLLECLNKYVPTVSGYAKTIIFVRKKQTADKLVKLLKKDDLYCRAFHSNKSQPERDFVIREFQKGTIPIICATDVAARGLDFKNVKLVVNYDFPQNIEEYIHRIGRTGRHTSKGIAYTLFTPENIRHKSNLISILQESELPVSQELTHLKPNTEPIINDLEDSDDESLSSG